ncbi:hypothetical protein HUG10_20550 (plasmid) [Halorarum halophilum]|uniref:Uncharacterized protein n=1 Tax=Halorarum halophilum TaxID=2743090 RepID=A0A7D5KAP1_9EURY|nr:hypothetical protein [Halobaculum halophilum]QLG29999.1 hypothetical protein HUG10_20550 [Halobaculum halophilum]
MSLDELQMDLEKCRFREINTKRNDDGSLRRVEVMIQLSTANSGSPVTFKYAVRGDDDRLKLTQVVDTGTTMTISKFIYMNVFAEHMLPKRIPDVESVESVEEKLLAARKLVEGGALEDEE